MALLEASGIGKNFGDTKVLKDISLTLEQGEALAIIGSSGSGKTTLLRCLNFLERPDTGCIRVNGETMWDAADPATQRESEIRKKRLHFGLVFQNFNLFPQYTALQNVMLAGELLAKDAPGLPRPNEKGGARPAGTAGAGTSGAEWGFRSGHDHLPAPRVSGGHASEAGTPVRPSRVRHVVVDDDSSFDDDLPTRPSDRYRRTGRRYVVGRRSRRTASADRTERTYYVRYRSTVRTYRTYQRTYRTFTGYPGPERLRFRDPGTRTRTTRLRFRLGTGFGGPGSGVRVWGGGNGVPGTRVERNGR